ncbi:N-acetylmuramoyl-L-alanine amidase [Listeria ilorinensis]|uniref:N-acetylmuramoyl-L-alanine amidase n=1 Tax=Listeria ilorinensis TaxID=2867439 RepID=UPI001EF45D4D|nr:N-acetylmuramoyl-L-alanine amidase [Listeria ilorinensis]
MRIKQDFLTINNWSRPGTKLTKVKGIVIHWYGNPGTTAQANRNYWESLKDGRGTYASAHFCISGDGSIVQALPENELAYQVGSAKGYTQNALDKLSSYPNNCVIGIENAHPDWNGKFYDADYDACVALAASLLKKYGLTQNDLWRHSDIVGAAYKDCPRYYTKNQGEWDKLKEDVRKKMGDSSASFDTGKYTIPPFSEAIGTLKTKMEMNIRSGPGTNYVVTRVAAIGSGHSVYESRNGWYRVSSGEWISGKPKYVQFSRKSSHPVKPVAEMHHNQYVYFPADEGTWRVYPLSAQALQAQYSVGTINPPKFGGLTYEVKKDRGDWDYEIETVTFGRVRVYCHPETGAKVSWSGPGNWPNVQP